MLTTWLGICLGSYLLGAVPFGLLVAKSWGGPDPRSGGSKNIGATNVGRLVGKPAGVLTLLLDVAKGTLPVSLAWEWLGPQAGALAGLCAFGGHVWPVYLGFKGGKGVATALGVFLGLSPWALLGVLTVFVAAVWRTGFVSVGSLAGCGSAPLWMLLLGKPWPVVVAALAMALVVFWRHRENISRLRAGQEHGLNLS
jgi:glycerol-3-phosphate acyltransferase PlsY